MGIADLLKGGAELAVHSPQILKGDRAMYHSQQAPQIVHLTLERIHLVDAANLAFSLRMGPPLSDLGMSGESCREVLIQMQPHLWMCSIVGKECHEW